MAFKFEKLEVWQMAVDYIDVIDEIARLLPKSEEYNLKSQMMRAATSVALNVAEGSTGQTDAEQARFLGMALRSLIETVACQHLISRRKLLADIGPLRQAYQQAMELSIKLQAFRNTVSPDRKWLREEPVNYLVTTDMENESDIPF